MSKRTEKTITLGSGKIYIDEYKGKIPTHEEIQVSDKLLGYVQGGAGLTYTPEFYTGEDDLGVVKKTILTKEESKLKSGIMTWNAKTLDKLASTGRVTEDTEKGIRTIKIGGTLNQNGKSYVIHFFHEDKIDGNVWVTIVGKNTAGFELSFAKDKETIIDAEFTAEPCDDEGTLIVYEEEIEKAVPLKVDK